MTQAGIMLGPAGSGPAAERFSDWLQSRAARLGERVALEPGRVGVDISQVSYAGLQRRSQEIAHALYGLGLRAGDAIAVWLPNRPEWVAVHLAATRLGLITIPFNTWFRESEVAHFLRLAGCRALVLDSSFRGIDFGQILAAALGALEAEGSRARLEFLIETGGAPERCSPLPVGVTTVRLAAIAGGAPDGGVDAPEANPRAIAFSTSGTTSLPKLAVHGERALLTHARAVAQRAGMGVDDVVLGALPPCGAYGYTLLMAALSAGSRVVMIEELDFDLVLSLIEERGVTVLALTEPLMRRLLDQAAGNPRSLRSLRLAFSAGATLADVVERAEREFGFRLSNVYGSSEVLALAAFWDGTRDVAARSAAGGLLTSPGMRVRAAGPDGETLPTGSSGELQFSGPVITAGYLSNEEATRKAFSADGWLRSGDLGSIVDPDAGEFLYVARMSDSLRIKGFLVAPGEIESMLQQHPAVASAQVVGIPDGVGEELAAAFVILRPGFEATVAELRDFCRARMASYKAPALIGIVDSYPMTRSANGDKVMKNRLRDMANAMVRQ